MVANSGCPLYTTEATSTTEPSIALPHSIVICSDPNTLTCPVIRQGESIDDPVIMELLSELQNVLIEGRHALARLLRDEKCVSQSYLSRTLARA